MILVAPDWSLGVGKKFAIANNGGVYGVQTGPLSSDVHSLAYVLSLSGGLRVPVPEAGLPHPLVNPWNTIADDVKMTGGRAGFLVIIGHELGFPPGLGVDTGNGYGINLGNLPPGALAAIKAGLKPGAPIVVGVCQYNGTPAQRQAAARDWANAFGHPVITMVRFPGSPRGSYYPGTGRVDGGGFQTMPPSRK